MAGGISNGSGYAYCFVHAPTSEGWEGELVLVLRRRNRNDGKATFRLADVQTIIEHLFPDDSPDAFLYNENVTEDQLEVYLSRKEQGLMQRRSIYNTYEEMYFEEWERNILKKYPDIYFLKGSKHGNKKYSDK
jgi:hypothetical protein